MIGLIVAFKEFVYDRNTCDHHFVKDDIDKGGIICKHCRRKVSRAIIKYFLKIVLILLHCLFFCAKIEFITKENK